MYKILAQGVYKGCGWKIQHESGNFYKAQIKAPKSLQKLRRDVESLPFLKKHRLYLIYKDYSKKDPNKFDLWIWVSIFTRYHEDLIEKGKAMCEEFIDQLVDLEKRVKLEQIERLAKKLTMEG